MFRFRNLAKVLFVSCLATATAALPQAAGAKSFQVLHRFAGGDDGRFPSGPLIADPEGNLYGVTSSGGSKGLCKIENGCGVAYRIAADGTYTVLYAFQGGKDGYAPEGNLLLAADGNLYGTTILGGDHNGGTVYSLGADGTKTILHSFAGSPDDGLEPGAGLIADETGSVYGTTEGGGANQFNGGTVFKIAPDGTETVLYSFCSLQNCMDGQNPVARLLLDGNGNLYGTTSHGGEFDKGTVFKIGSGGAFSVAYSFGTTSDDGGLPQAGLISDSLGNLYGTTAGSIFAIALDGTETTLSASIGSSSELLLDNQGNLFGTSYDEDVAFELDRNGSLRIIHYFGSGGDGRGAYPDTGLTWLSGKMYGATNYGGRSCRSSGCGVVYELQTR